MRKASIIDRLLPVLASAAALAGCMTRPLEPLPEDEFTSTNVYSNVFPGTPEQSCEAGRRALLSQGYIVGEASKEFVKAGKQFQPKNDMHQQIEFNLVCAVNGRGSNSTTVFVSAVREHYTVRKSSTSASLGVGALGSVSLPIGSNSDALVKVGSETIPDKQFYRRFFTLLESYLDPNDAYPAADRDDKPDKVDTAADEEEKSGKIEMVAEKAESADKRQQAERAEKPDKLDKPEKAGQAQRPPDATAGTGSAP